MSRMRQGSGVNKMLEMDGTCCQNLIRACGVSAAGQKFVPRENARTGRRMERFSGVLQVLQLRKADALERANSPITVSARNLYK